MFIRDGFWGLFLIAVLNLNIHIWSYMSFRKITQSCGCPGMSMPLKGHPTKIEKKEVNFYAAVNLGTYAISIGLIIYGVMLSSPVN
jgi:hypothetical protein